MVSQFINSSANYKYRQEGRNLFIAYVDSQNEESKAIDRLLQTEKQIIKNRQTAFLEKQDLKYIRESKYSARLNNGGGPNPSGSFDINNSNMFLSSTSRRESHRMAGRVRES